MKNANEPVMPVNEMSTAGEVAVAFNVHKGLTKREYLAGLALQGLCSHPMGHRNPELLASDAVTYADALLKEFNQ